MTSWLWRGSSLFVEFARFPQAKRMPRCLRMAANFKTNGGLGRHADRERDARDTNT